VTNNAAIPNGWSLSDGRQQCGPLGVELDRATSVTYGMFRTIAEALALYYRSLGIASTLLKSGNISSRLYC
jgi:hypothetical protein